MTRRGDATHAAQSKTGDADGPERAPRRLKAAGVWTVAISLLVVAAMFLFVFPTRAYLAKRDEAGKAKSELALIERANKALEAQKKKLQSDAEIERLARERFNLVKPGENAFAIVPEITTTTTSTTTAPAPSPTP